MNNFTYNNNYNIAKAIFDDILSWAADKHPTLTKEQKCADIEKILDFLEDKHNNSKNKS